MSVVVGDRGEDKSENRVEGKTGNGAESGSKNAGEDKALRKTRWLGINTVSAALPIGLFLIAGRITSVGREDGFTVAELLSAFAAACVILPLVAYAAEELFGEKEGGRRVSVFLIIISLVAVCAAFYVAIFSVIQLVTFSAEAMRLKISGTVVALIFLWLCAYLSQCGSFTMRKIGLTVAVFIVFGALLLLVFSFPAFELEKLNEFMRKGSSFEPRGAIKAFCTVFAPITMAVLYVIVSGTPRTRGNGALSVSLGSFWGFALLGLCFLNSLLILGTSMGEVYEHPYVEAVSTVTAGKLFAGMEGVSYMMYFGALTVRVSVCISLVCQLVGRMLPDRLEYRKRLRTLPYILAGIIFLSVCAVRYFLL